MRGYGTGAEIHRTGFWIMTLVDSALLCGHRRIGRLARGQTDHLLDTIGAVIIGGGCHHAGKLD